MTQSFTDELEEGSIVLSSYELHRLIKVAQKVLADQDHKTKMQIRGKAREVHLKMGQHKIKEAKAPKLPSGAAAQIALLEKLIADQQAIIDQLTAV